MSISGKWAQNDRKVDRDRVAEKELRDAVKELQAVWRERRKVEEALRASESAALYARLRV